MGSEGLMTYDLLLDTHVFLWLMEGDEKLSKEALKKIFHTCEKEGRIYLSAISVWKIVMLIMKNRIKIKQPIFQWIQAAFRALHINLDPLPPEISLERCCLSDSFHQDSVDHMIVASARILSVPLVTKDERILRYARRIFEGYFCISLSAE